MGKTVLIDGKEIEVGRPKKNLEKNSNEDLEYLDATFVRSQKRDIFSLSPAADQILGGGIPSGSAVIISGHEGLGKTTAALKIARSAQQKGRVAVLCDIEERFKPLNLESVRDFDPSPEAFKLIASRKGDILYAQDQMARAEKAMIDFPGCIVILDSLSSLLARDSKGEEYGKGFQLSSRKIEGDFFKRIAALKRINDCTVIAIAHIASNIGSPGYHDVTSKYSQYAADVKLTIGYPGTPTPFLWKSGEKIIGHHVKWEVDKSALGPSGGKCIGKLRYGIGFDDVAEIVSLAESLSVIEKGGSWYTIPGCDKQLQGMEQVCEMLENDTKIFDNINKQVRDLLYEG